MKNDKKANGLLLILVSLLLLASFGALKGQRIDSLKYALKYKSGLERCDILFELAREYSGIDDTLGLEFASEGFKTAKRIGDSLRIVKAGRIKAAFFEDLGIPDSSIMISNEILLIAVRNNYDEEMKYILNLLGSGYTFKAEYDKALQFHYQSLEWREKSLDLAAVSIALNNIGLVYYKMKDYDQALSYYERTLKNRRQKGIKIAYGKLLLNISLCHAYKNNFSEARNFVSQAFAQCGGSCSDDFLLNAWFCQAVISFGLNNFADAETQFLKSYSLAEELVDERFQLDNIVYLSQVYLKLNNMTQAEEYLSKGEKLIASGTPYNLELIKVYEGLCNLHTKSGNFEKVARYQQKYIQLKDSVYSEELTRNLMKVEAEYLERENKAMIETQSKILALNDEVIYRQRFINGFVGIIALLLIALTWVLNKSNKQKRMVNELLEKKVKERTLELELNRDTLQRSLDERAVVFQKLSTDIKSSLATIKGLCSLGLKDYETKDGSQYIRKIELTSNQLSGILSRTLANTLET